MSKQAQVSQKFKYKSLIFKIIFLLSVLIVTSSALNTHQNITKDEAKKLIKVKVKQRDRIRVSIFNTNAQYELVFYNQASEIALSKQGVCFMGQLCSLQFVSEWNLESQVQIEVSGYEYSYEVLINDQTVKRQTGVTDNFRNGKFLYSKYIRPGTYTFKIFYEQKQVPKLKFVFMNQSFDISSDTMNQINITLQQSLPFYIFHFASLKQYAQYTVTHHLNITISIPNEILKGCDGTNTYDPKIRSCPYNNNAQDRILSIFLNQTNSKDIIKITFVEQIRWRELLKGQNLTIFVANSSDQKIFHNFTKPQIIAKFRNKEECLMKSPSCNFIFRLQPGNYTVMSVFLDAPQMPLVYLFERGDGKLVFDTFYSVTPIQSSDKRFYFLGLLVQFQTLKQKKTQFQILCDEEFLLLQYNVLTKSKQENKDGQFQIQLCQLEERTFFSQDTKKSIIPLELQPNSHYLLLAIFASKHKYKIQAEVQQTIDTKDEKQQEADIKQNGQEVVEQKNPAKGDLQLQSQTMQLRIRNGKFPHKKIQEHNLLERIAQQDFISQWYLKVGIIVGIFLIGVLVLIFLKKRICKKTQKDIEQTELISTQTGQDKIGSSQIQISQGPNNQSSVSNTQQ